MSERIYPAYKYRIVETHVFSRRYLIAISQKRAFIVVFEEVLDY